ncbi:MAG: hypothetical protein HZB32_06200 [Nitrospirae bacterium]|nr:hypothetical protein [Nitrospirota bacterium]
MGIESDKDYFDVVYGPTFIDRRKMTLTNRLRRFLNNYWLIPVFTLCLELFAITLPSTNSPIKNLKDRNIYFLKGPVILYNLASTDFPYALIGHFKEIAIVKKYTFNIGQVPSENVARALEHKESVRKIYRRVIESRSYDNTEFGGIVTLANTPEGPELHLYEIASLNKVFSEKLHGLKNSSIEEFISFLQKQESRETLSKVGMDEHITDNLVRVLLSQKPDKDHKRILIKDFIKTYDIHSECKYILSPYDFKSILGSSNLEGKYVGLFHFHNNYMEPPSEVDIANSSADRQIVITLGDRGIVIYDLIKGKEFIYRGDLIS